MTFFGFSLSIQRQNKALVKSALRDSSKAKHCCALLRFAPLARLVVDLLASRLGFQRKDSHIMVMS